MPSAQVTAGEPCGCWRLPTGRLATEGSNPATISMPISMRRKSAALRWRSTPPGRWSANTAATRWSRSCIDEQVFYIVPRVNPDGAEIVQTLPFYEWIGNGRYLPGEEQFGAGLHYADVNGDGLIVDMRHPRRCRRVEGERAGSAAHAAAGARRNRGRLLSHRARGHAGRLGRRRFCDSAAPGWQPQPQLSVQLGAGEPAIWVGRASRSASRRSPRWCAGFWIIPTLPACSATTATAA